jgi:hypothetical protein
MATASASSSLLVASSFCQIEASNESCYVGAQTSNCEAQSSTRCAPRGMCILYYYYEHLTYKFLYKVTSMHFCPQGLKPCEIPYSRKGVHVAATITRNRNSPQIVEPPMVDASYELYTVLVSTIKARYDCSYALNARLCRLIIVLLQMRPTETRRWDVRMRRVGRTFTMPR